MASLFGKFNHCAVVVDVSCLVLGAMVAIIFNQIGMLHDGDFGVVTRDLTHVNNWWIYIS